MAKRAADQDQRDAALDPARSFIVQAPAGSGKTELLVRRYLKLLTLVKQPEEILAITFTIKAAAEMRKRVLEQIPNAAEIAHRLRIQTIDALCVSLTRQMPVLSRFGAQPAIVEKAEHLYREAASRTILGLGPDVERLLAHLDNDVAEATSLLARMLASRDRWLDKAGNAPGREALESALAFQRENLLGKAKALHPKASQDFANACLTQSGTWRKRGCPVAPEQQTEELREALLGLVSMPPENYDDAQWETLEAILALLKPAVAQLKVVFAEHGEADFTEFMRGSLQALGSSDDPSELLLKLDRKVSHILVDEFQDTSLSQKELLERLTAGWEQGDGRTLFLVGDPMQSIYRFREAEVGIFLAARREGIGAVELHPINLTANFRSQGGLVRWFNAAFPRVLPAAEDPVAGAVPYSAAAAHLAEEKGPAVKWHCFYDRDAEADRVVDVLKSAKGKSAILVRTRSHLDAIVPALRRAGIRWRAVEIETLGEKQVVQDLFALARALSHPADRIAWLSLLRARWCGLLLSDLIKLGSGLVFDSLTDLSALSPDGQLRAARLRDTLAPFVADRLRGTLRSRVEAAWLALGGAACVDNVTDLEDAETFLDELERLDEGGDVDMAELGERLEELYALPDVDAPEDAVEIMTIHKAKGLEFDTVLVPGLDRPPRGDDKPLLAWKSIGVAPLSRGDAAGGGVGSSGLLLAPINETGAGDDPIYQHVRRLERDAEDLEAARLLYVAATRAKSRLHLFACATADEDRNARQPHKRSLLRAMWHDAQEHFGKAPAEQLEIALRRTSPDTSFRVPAGFTVPPAPAPVHWTAPPEGREEEEIEFSWVGETARHVGTVVHRWLQLIADDQLNGWDAARVESLRPHFTRDLQRRGVTPQDLKASTDLVATALKNTLSDDRGRWILSPHAEARTEYRMRVRENGVSRTYIMDRVFRDERGERWIVDYKTSRHEGADLEGFLSREGERYKDQLHKYSTALGTASTGLYFPLLRGWKNL